MNCRTTARLVLALFSSVIFACRAGSIQIGVDPQANSVDPNSFTLASPQDKLPDYSWAGAWYSNQPLPATDRPANVVITSTNDRTDRTQDIQAAIDKLAAVGGGVIELAAGAFHLTSTTINLFSQNVTVRGLPPVYKTAGFHTTIVASGQPRYIFAFGDPAAKPFVSKTSRSSITDDYVPVGSQTIHVTDSSLFHVGQEIYIRKTLSKEWIASMGMDRLVRDGKKQTWIRAGRVDTIRRQITGLDLDKDALTFDVPLVDSIDAGFGTNADVLGYKLPDNTASANSIEDLLIILDKDESGLSLTARAFPGARVCHPAPMLMGHAGVAVFNGYSQDNWVRRVASSGFLSSYLTAPSSRRVTFSDVAMFRPSSTNKAAGYPADIQLQGMAALVLRCSTFGVQGSKSWSVVTESLAPGPNSVVQYRSYRAEHIIEPHARWATGFLVDNSHVGGAELINRKTAGSGHGWAAGNSIIWNTVAMGEIGIETPPNAFNFCVACSSRTTGKTSNHSAFLYQGDDITEGTNVTPASLFEYQLAARIGSESANAVLAPLDDSSIDADCGVEVGMGIGIRSIQGTSLPQGEPHFVKRQCVSKRAKSRTLHGNAGSRWRGKRSL